MSSEINQTPPYESTVITDPMPDPVPDPVLNPVPDPMPDPVPDPVPVLEEDVAINAALDAPEENTVVATGVEEPATGVEEPAINVENSKDGITLTTNKATLTKLGQNLNANLLVTLAAYKNILIKLKDSINDEIKKTELDANIKKMSELETDISNLLVSVQDNLDAENKLDPTKVVSDVAGSDNFMQGLFNAEAISILGAMMLPLALAGGSKRKKKTKRNRNKNSQKKKSTKRVIKL